MLCRHEMSNCVPGAHILWLLGHTFPFMMELWFLVVKGEDSYSFCSVFSPEPEEARALS